jgi:hyperosmotically inducible protein
MSFQDFPLKGKQMQSINKSFALASSLALLFALGACGERVSESDRAAAEQAQPSVSTEANTTAATGPVTPAPTTSEMGAGSSVGMIDDAQIVTKVNAALAADTDLSALKIDVDSKNGMVTLKGKAPDAAAKDRAEQLVKSMQDVKSVDNQLTLG